MYFAPKQKLIFFVKNFYSIWMGVAMLILQSILFGLLSSSDFFLDLIHATFWQNYQSFIGGFTSWFYFSIGDVVYFLLFVCLIYQFLLFVISIINKKVFFADKSILSVLIFVNILFFTYSLLWGINYSKKSPYDEYLQVEIQDQELKKIATDLLISCIYKRKLSLEDSLGIYRLKQNPEDFFVGLEMSHQKQNWQEKYKMPIQSNQKKSLYSFVLSYMGIGGYYNPFSTEAQYNTNLPDSKILFTYTHEVAHQMGFAREGEANYIAYTLLNDSDNYAWQYQAKLRALGYVMREISKTDTIFTKQILEDFSPAMKRDLENEKKIREKYKSPLSDYFSKINDVFLQLNKQEDGVESYGLFVKYLVCDNRYNKIGL